MEQDPQDRRAFCSLADFLAVDDVSVKAEERQPVVETFDASMSVQDFAKGILNSVQYRESILRRVLMDELPPAMEALLWSHAYGVPPKKIEHTGKDGNPIETITEVRRTIVHVQAPPAEAGAPAEKSVVH